MVLSNYKCIHIRIQNSKILLQDLQVYTISISKYILRIESNSINSTIRNRLLLQSIHFRNVPFEAVALQSSTETSRKLHSTRRNPRDSSNSTFYSGTHPELHTPCRRQRVLHPVQKLNSTCRRQRDL